MNLEKNNNSKIVKKLSGKSFSSNITRNLTSIGAIILTTVMFTALFTVYISIVKTEEKAAMRQVGTSTHFTFKDISETEQKQISTNTRIKESGISISIGIGVNDELLANPNNNELIWGDSFIVNHSYSIPTVGRMPIKENEIAVGTDVLDSLGIPHQLGKVISLTWIQSEKPDKKITTKFTLCGYWKTDYISGTNVLWISKELADKYCKSNDIAMSVNINNVRNLEDKAEQILKECNLSKIRIGINWAYSNQKKLENLKSAIPYLFGIFLIFASGYLIIYNIFQISISQDIRFYGMLKTLGTTKKQIKKIVMAQAIRVSIIGIPMGLCIGYVVGIYLVPIVAGMSRDEVVLSNNSIIFLVSFLFAFLTVIISCIRPAIIAGKISPIEALVYTDINNSSFKKEAKRKNGTNLVRMAIANMGRNKKRTVLIICSMALGLVLFNSIYAIVQSFDIDKFLSGNIISDFQLSQTSISLRKLMKQSNRSSAISKADELIIQLKELDDLKQISELYYWEESTLLSADTHKRIINFFEGKRYEQMEYDKTWIKAYNKMKKTKQVVSSLYGIDSYLAEKGTILEGTWDLEKFNSGNYVLVGVNESIMMDGEKNVPTWRVGEQITIAGHSYEVMALLDMPYPIGDRLGSRESAFSLEVYMPVAELLKINSELEVNKIFIDIKEKKIAQIETWLINYKSTINPKLIYKNKQTYINQYKRETSAMTVMGQVLSILIALIGILNYVNSHSTSIISRKNEFTIMQSIGMTTHQLKKMLITEGLIYEIFSIILAIILSSIVLEIGVKTYISIGWTQTYRFSLLPIITCIPIITCCAILIPTLCLKTIKKKTIVERLRER